MSPNFKEVHCIYCGRIVRSTDKFCIFCGNHLPGQDGKPENAKKADIPKEELKDLEKEVNDDLQNKKMIQNLTGNPANPVKNEAVPFMVTETSIDKLDDRVLGTGLGKDKGSDSSGGDIQLPDNIKEQMEIKMQLALIEEKKATLKLKLKDLTENLNDNRYEHDLDYAQEVNVKLNALKTLKQEMEEKEEQLRKDLGGVFHMDELEEILALKREQLIELKRSFKHHQIKKDIYDQLKVEYVDNYTKADKELQDLRMNMIRWLSKERAEKSRIESHIRLAQGRLKAREIDQKTYDEQKANFDKDIQRFGQRIKILEAYSREKKRKML